MFLEVNDLNVDLGEFYLKNASLSLEKQDYLVLIGPTGSGKSVLLETIAGFYQAKSGKVVLDGKDITDLSPENRGISIVYQDNVLFPHMNVFDNIAYGLKKKTEDKELIDSKIWIQDNLKIDPICFVAPYGKRNDYVWTYGLMYYPYVRFKGTNCIVFHSLLDNKEVERLENFLKGENI